MKLADFLQDFFETTGPTGSPFNSPGSPFDLDEYFLSNAQLRLLKERLLECEEFEHTKEIIIMDKPTDKYINSKGEEQDGTALTMKMADGMKFGEKVYLWSISLTTTVFDSNELANPIKDDVSVSPSTYDLETFKPRKSITVFWSPEVIQDEAVINPERDLKEELVDKFRKALDNPKEYEPVPKKGILIRGIYNLINPDEKFGNMYVTINNK